MQSLTKLARSRLPSSSRQLHSSFSPSYPRRAAVGIPAPPVLAKTGLFLDEDQYIENDIPYEERAGQGSSSLGHLLLRQQRHLLNYMRIIEHDMPNLVRFREPFVPPSSSRPVVVRSIDYGGEEHPATAKRTVVVAVSRLPLKGPNAQHAFKLLAGPRWSPSLPSDSGIGPGEGKESNGYIKISCEDFPQPGMNLKWISDVLDRLIEEANATGATFKHVPLDMRYLEAKKRKAKKGEGRSSYRTSLRDFPPNWLPPPTPA